MRVHLYYIVHLHAFFLKSRLTGNMSESNPNQDQKQKAPTSLSTISTSNTGKYNSLINSHFISVICIIVFAISNYAKFHLNQSRLRDILCRNFISFKNSKRLFKILLMFACFQKQIIILKFFPRKIASKNLK
jgi:hypothetical protein